jgi:hypothetical protein
MVLLYSLSLINPSLSDNLLLEAGYKALQAADIGSIGAVSDEEKGDSRSLGRIKKETSNTELMLTCH